MEAVAFNAAGFPVDAKGDLIPPVNEKKGALFWRLPDDTFLTRLPSGEWLRTRDVYDKNTQMIQEIDVEPKAPIIKKSAVAAASQAPA